MCNHSDIYQAKYTYADIHGDSIHVSRSIYVYKSTELKKKESHFQLYILPSSIILNIAHSVFCDKYIPYPLTKLKGISLLSIYLLWVFLIVLIKKIMFDLVFYYCKEGLINSDG